MKSLLLSLSLLLAPETAPSTRPADELPTVIVVVGAEGSTEFGTGFAKWADRWAAAAGRGRANLIQIGRADATGSQAESDADKQRLRAVLEAEVGTVVPATGPATSPASQPGGSTRPSAATRPAVTVRPSAAKSPLWIVLIGHGTFDGREAKFNLRGSDVSDQELAEWLRPCHRPLAVVNCTSASAPFLNRLSGPDRVVVTATRSGGEQQFARFGAYLSAAVADPSADLDKDGQTSLLEAFLAASHRTAEFYKEAGRLATEHALLEDNGDALGTPADWFQGTRAVRAAKSGAALDGHRAHQWHLVLSPSEQALPPEARARRDALELKIQSLRDRKASMPEVEYYAQLEGLLLDLARVYEKGGQ